MRCTKCGNISWDHVTVCNACGQDLTGVQEMLGRFLHPEKGFSWFDSGHTEEASMTSSEPPIDLSSIDVSDLISEGASPPQEDITPSSEDIDLNEIKEILEDEELQEALEVLDKDL